MTLGLGGDIEGCDKENDRELQRLKAAVAGCQYRGHAACMDSVSFCPKSPVKLANSGDD
jgi:hypothetical protein